MRLRRRCLDSQARFLRAVENGRDPSTTQTGSLCSPVCCAQDDRALLVAEGWWLFLCELAAVTAVEDVDQEAKAEPDYKSQPCDDRKPGHEAAAEND
jgi:hypothetical protein